MFTLEARVSSASKAQAGGRDQMESIIEQLTDAYNLKTMR